jgi:hypothetical protein
MGVTDGHERGQHAGALGPACKATLNVGAERMPDYQSILVWLATAAARIGRDREARDAAARLMRLQLDFTIASR